MTEQTEYRVLARKYRPQVFAELIGQDVLVKTLTNAISTNRIPHAILLTGIRGVGKTTTARLIAKALNYAGADGKSGPTIAPKDDCEHARAIAESRHIDVLEMDAASRTGVDNIREIIDNAQYKPVSARYKIFIIDEVHMLSKSAFNALLKTLEEPPPHVKFIFATTELRKIPVTVLSRCMRFDLARVSETELAEHLERICEKEGFSIEQQALMLIAHAAEGSVRDSLSLLDQAMALSGDDGKNITATRIRAMLGATSREKLFSVLDAIADGKSAEAVEAGRALYQAGADPLMLVQDLLELTHLVTQVREVPNLSSLALLPETDRTKVQAYAGRFSIPYLTRMWQILLKGLEEIRVTPHPLMALDMLIIRLCYVSDLPPPGELVKKMAHEKSTEKSETPVRAPERVPSDILMQAPAQKAHLAMPKNYHEVVALFEAKQEYFYANWLKSDVHLVRYEPGSLEFRPISTAPKDLAGKVGAMLERWTGARWVVAISQQQGQQTLKSEQDAAMAKQRAVALEDPMVQAVLHAFPGAKVSRVVKQEVQKNTAETDISTPSLLEEARQ